MKWSRYNLLFKSERNGWLLYNSGSNTFIQLNENMVEITKRLKDNPDVDVTDIPDLYMALKDGGFIVEDGQDDNLVRILKMKRLSSSYASHKLSLTICPTTNCNFNCEYCYQQRLDPTKMSEETEDNIIRFIESQKAVNKLKIFWCGGEPLLELGQMKRLNKKIVALGIEYTSEITTNGYLLTPDAVDAFDELNINFVQITIDGLKETHDKRRCLVGGGATHDKIVENIDYLVQSDWSGFLLIRVNVDPRNYEEFANVYRFFEKKFSDIFGVRLVVFPIFVHSHDPAIGCYLNPDVQGEFILKWSQTYGIVAFQVLQRMILGSSCIANCNSSYAVWSNGDLYKCWLAMGRQSRQVETFGNINCSTNWNQSFLAEYVVGASFLEDENCKKCIFFPICNGGCPFVRVLNNRGDRNINVCPPLKMYSKEFLEINFELRKKASNIPLAQNT